MWKIDATEIDELANRIAQTGEQAEKIINDVLHNYAGQEIIDHITPLIPESGRTWKGKKKPAKVSQPFREEQGNLYVVVKTKTPYNYLYFPDTCSIPSHSGQYIPQNKVFFRSEQFQPVP